MSAAQNTKGVLAVRLGRAGIITLLAAAALSLYALAGIAGAGAEIERNSRTREAFDAAVAAARPGETVLLSPACSSFDEFSNMAERGRLFKELVRGLSGTGE